MLPRSDGRQGEDRTRFGAVRWEVLHVKALGGAEAALTSHLDGPAAGMRAEDAPLRIVGWAVSEASPVRQVEVAADGAIVGQAGVDRSRPGVASKFAGVAGAESAGFELLLDPAGEGVSELVVEGVLEDGSRAPIAAIRVEVVPCEVPALVAG